MNTLQYTAHRPPIHLLASELDIVAALALRAEARQPRRSNAAPGRSSRPQPHDLHTMPPGHAGLSSHVTDPSHQTQQVRSAAALPGEADIAQGRVSTGTPMGAALYGFGRWDIRSTGRSRRQLPADQTVRASEAEKSYSNATPHSTRLLEEDRTKASMAAFHPKLPLRE